MDVLFGPVKEDAGVGFKVGASVLPESEVGTVVEPGAIVTLPGAVVVLPGATVAFPGDTVAFPGAKVAFPGANVAFPGDDGACVEFPPGADVEFPCGAIVGVPGGIDTGEPVWTPGGDVTVGTTGPTGDIVTVGSAGLTDGVVIVGVVGPKGAIVLVGREGPIGAAVMVGIAGPAGGVVMVGTVGRAGGVVIVGTTGPMDGPVIVGPGTTGGFIVGVPPPDGGLAGDSVLTDFEGAEDDFGTPPLLTAEGRDEGEGVDTGASVREGGPIGAKVGPIGPDGGPIGDVVGFKKTLSSTVRTGGFSSCLVRIACCVSHVKSSVLKTYEIRRRRNDVTLCPWLRSISKRVRSPDILIPLSQGDFDFPPVIATIGLDSSCCRVLLFEGLCLRLKFMVTQRIVSLQMKGLFGASTTWECCEMFQKGTSETFRRIES